MTENCSNYSNRTGHFQGSTRASENLSSSQERSPVVERTHLAAVGLTSRKGASRSSQSLSVAMPWDISGALTARLTLLGRVKQCHTPDFGWPFPSKMVKECRLLYRDHCGEKSEFALLPADMMRLADERGIDKNEVDSLCVVLLGQFCGDDSCISFLRDQRPLDGLVRSKEGFNPTYLDNLKSIAAERKLINTSRFLNYNF